MKIYLQINQCNILLTCFRNESIYKFLVHHTYDLPIIVTYRLSIQQGGNELKFPRGAKPFHTKQVRDS